MTPLRSVGLLATASSPRPMPPWRPAAPTDCLVSLPRPAQTTFIPGLHDRAKIEQLYMSAGRASSSNQLHRVNGVLHCIFKSDVKNARHVLSI